MKRFQFITLSLLMVLLIGAVLITQVNASPLRGGGAPTVVSCQGVVKDGGAPFTGTGYFKFALVNAAGDTSYWSNDGSSTGGSEPDTYITLPVVNGLFQALLGDTDLANMISLPASSFSGTDRYLRIWFSAGEIIFTQLSPDQRIAAVPYALQAEEAVKADSLDGLDSTDFVGVSGDTMTGTLTLAGDPVGDLDAATKGYVDDLEARVAILESELAAVQTLLASVSLENGGMDLVFTGVNVHVRSGTGYTYGTINGLGNLILGYNENSGDARTGSHNLVIGPFHSYSSYGNLISGYNHTASGIYSSISGGSENTASGYGSSVSGGNHNLASGVYSSVSGGVGNEASGDYSSVRGGFLNRASGLYSLVSGGAYNTASNSYSSISGGTYNTASGEKSSVSGGYQNIASGRYSSVSGGVDNEAGGESSTIGGGANGTVTGGADWLAGTLFEEN